MDREPTAARSPGSGRSKDRFDWHPEPELVGIRDPAVSREALRAAGAATWEAALDYLYEHAFEHAREQPVDYDDLRAQYFGPSGRPGPAPAGPTALAPILDEFRDRIAPHMLSAYHPRSYGYFTPPPLFASIAGEVLAQFAQQGIDVWHAGPVGAFVEEEVVRWLCDLLGYGRDSFGVLTSGGVMANFIAMAIARDVHVPFLRGVDRPPRGRDLERIRVYSSDQTHFSIGRALDELGFPPDTLVVVPADRDFRLRGDAVAAAIAKDRRAGLLPAAISAVAGSTNTGAVDAVGELADVAAAERLWLHVDAAYGAAARLSPRIAARMPDLDRADSVTVDPHKWFFQAYDIGGLMVRRGDHLAAAFGGHMPEYYRGGDRPLRGRPEPVSNEARVEEADAGAGAGAGAADAGPDSSDGAPQGDDRAGHLNFWKLGFEGTRRFRALKLWFSWKHIGSSGFAQLIEANVDLAAHLARRIAASTDFEALPADPPLSVVCFRHLADGLDARLLDAHQDRLQAALEASGDGWLSTTRLRGATYLRAGILNTQADEADIDALLDRLRQLAAQL